MRLETALITGAGTFHPWDAMAPRALAAIAARGPFVATAETGCGGSTIVLSQLSGSHVAFAIDGEDGTIRDLCERKDLRRETVRFVDGPTEDTLPAYRFETPLDLVLLDGPHAYPQPQIEFAYLFPHIRPQGWLVLDDLQIPSVYELFSFLMKEKSVVLEEVAVRTAFFRKTGGEGSAGPDGWWLQGMNRRLIWKYAWKDQVRKLLRRDKLKV